jgi:hypothetical protein
MNPLKSCVQRVSRNWELSERFLQSRRSESDREEKKWSCLDQDGIVSGVRQEMRYTEPYSVEPDQVEIDTDIS